MSSFVRIKKPYRYKTQSIKGIRRKNFCLKLNHEEISILKQASTKLDTKFITFIKYCAIESAKKIMKE